MREEINGMTMIGMMISDYQVRRDGKGVRARDDQLSSDIDVLVRRKTHGRAPWKKRTRTRKTARASPTIAKKAYIVSKTSSARVV